MKQSLNVDKRKPKEMQTDKINTTDSKKKKETQILFNW